MPLKGSGQEVGQLPKIKCTYGDCNKRFNSEKEMKGHKLSEPEHNFCKKCNVDCTSWEDLTQHKVSMMSEFMHDKLREPDAAPKHITCEFCGEDFKSFGGRKRHRSQMHIADQSLYCPAKDEGCSGLFTRASHMIHHLESGECRHISADQFKASVQHKHMWLQIMKNWDDFRTNLEGSKAFAANIDQPGQITDGYEMQDQEEGGVAIMDQENEEQKRGYHPLQAESNLVDLNVQHVPLTRSNLETWPRLPGQAASQLTEEAMRSMSIGSRATSVTGRESEYASDVTSRRGGRYVYTESYPSLNSPINAASTYGDDEDDAASDTTATAANSTPRPTAWSTGQTSTALFRGAAPKVAAGDWAAFAESREMEIVASAGKNILWSRFYDPASPDYHIDYFFHPVVEMYCCPLPGCQASYEAPSEIVAHLQTAHIKTNYNCTTCMKRFKCATALTAHMESTGRCNVKDSNNYGHLLDEISGGFLKSKRINEPKIYAPETALVRAGKPTNGVMSVEFKAKLPEQK
ncbi:hypothetical protein LTR36_009937 [Oleoguttula mirabilis]|uniref:C2H2-type domain-containing protein n=1 Tax=Oleoguttula mirabilis TaxID=1507867 RepID=A0AAV9J4S3_9PEZI|nr:hypothetical protein LTR36_009937 [Oleoguttula mirabilis]